MNDGWFIRNVELAGRRRDLRIAGGLIAEVGDQLVPGVRDQVIDGAGGAVLPGLADHHVHLAATAAAMLSIDAAGSTEAGLASAIAMSAREVVRVVGWHESEPLGDLDAGALDRIAPGRAVRVQHRSGSLWVLSTALLRRLPDTGHPGLERDAAGRPTGRLFQGHRWLRACLDSAPPSFGTLAAALSGFGITHVTDATPHHDLALAENIRSQLRQHVSFMGITSGAPVKLLLPEHELPDHASLTGQIAEYHAQDRPVAIHTVTRASLLLALAAFEDAGSLPGDRLEHAAVVPVEVRSALRALTVVTQPAIAATRGDAHLAGVEPDDHDNLWPVASLLAQGVRVGLSSDSPHGPLDPWLVMRCARDRLTPQGRLANARERISSVAALAAMTTPLGDPGGQPRRVETGASADLILCHAPEAEVLRTLDSQVVRMVLRSGERISGE